MSHGLDGLKMAIGVILTCVVITMALYLARQGQDAGNAVGQMNNNIIASIEASELNDYITDDVTGADVVNFIRKFHEDLDIFTLQRTTSDMQNGSSWQGTNIITNGNSDLALNYAAIAWNERDPVSVAELSDGAKSYGFSIKNYAGNKYLLEDTNFSKNIPGTSMYINPNNSYRGYAIKNANGVVTGMYFVQTDDVQVAVSPGNGGNVGGVPNGNVNAGGNVYNNSGIDNSTILAISQTVNAIASTVERLTTELADIRSDITGAANNGSSSTIVGGTTGSTDALQTQISSLSEQYSLLTSALNDVKNALQGMTLDSDISDLKTGVANNADALTELNGKLTNITTKLNDVETKLTLLEAQLAGAPTTSGSGITGNSTSALETLSEVNAELTAITDMILDATDSVDDESAEALKESVEGVKSSLQSADEVTDMLNERAVE